MNEKISALNRAKQTLQTILLVITILTVFCLLLSFKVPAAGAVLFLVLIAAYFLYYKRKVSQFKQQVKQTIIEEGLRSFLKDITYQQKQGVPAEEITGARFIPAEHPKNLLIRDTVRGTYQMLPVLLTDLTADFQAAFTDKKGKEQKVTDFLSGCYFDIQLAAPAGTDCILLPKSYMPAEARDIYFGHLACLDAPGELAKDYCLYAADKENPPCLPEEFLKAFQRLIEYTPGQAAVQLSGRHLRVFIRRRFVYTVDIPMRTEITARLLSSNPFAEMHYLLRLADALR